MLGAAVEDAMVNRMVAIVTRGLRAECGIAERRGDVGLDVRGRVRRNQHALFLRMPGDARVDGRETP